MLPPPPSPPCVKILNLSRRFSTQNVLNHVNLEIFSGETVALLGENGSGKTTLLKILSTLLLPSTGEATIEGLSIHKDAQKIRHKIGWLSTQEGGFFPRLTGRQNLRCFGALRRANPRQIEEVIESFKHLAPFREALTTPFCVSSSGMKQSLALARAFLGNPSVLILDEPTRSLDTTATAEFQNLLAGPFAHKTIFFSTHTAQGKPRAHRHFKLEAGTVMPL